MKVLPRVGFRQQNNNNNKTKNIFFFFGPQNRGAPYTQVRLIHRDLRYYQLQFNYQYKFDVVLSIGLFIKKYQK